MTKEETRLNKLAAINSYNADCNMLNRLKEVGKENSVLWILTMNEMKELEMKYPSLKTNLYI